LSLSEDAADAHSRPGRRSPELLALAGLTALAIGCIAVSWRRWPDPLVDFGRELYVPWRLAAGALLYRDVDDFYGPLSQYFNAALFRLFGPGLMVLVMANLAVFAGICALAYRSFRAAWGWVGAAAALTVFVVVFGFAQYTEYGNYNYATPYSHEATHGLLLCLALVAVAQRWWRSGGRALAFAAGTLAGATLLLKPEVMLAAAAATLMVAALRRPTLAECGAWAAGLAWPTLAAFAFFAARLPWLQALEYAGRAWWSVVFTTRFTGDPSQLAFLGFDAPWPNARAHLAACAIALALAGLVLGAARLAEAQGGSRGARLPAVALALACLVGARWIPWIDAGRALAGLLLLYLAWQAWRWRAGKRGEREVMRLLLAALALALMARMALNGRIYQYGFVQAALAAMVVVAVALAELPALAALGPRGGRVARAGFAATIASGVLALFVQSHSLLQLKNYPVAGGRDRFYAYDPRVERTGEFVRAAVEALAQANPGGEESLLVLPDGQMLNYLARSRSPVPATNFFSSATADGREALIVGQLQRAPPGWVVLVGRDLREFGVHRYGEREGQGLLLLRWLQADYEVAATAGGNPLQGRDGIMLWQRRKKGPAPTG
jgi:hypothetical protein